MSYPVFSYVVTYMLHIDYIRNTCGQHIGFQKAFLETNQIVKLFYFSSLLDKTVKAAYDRKKVKVHDV